MVHEGVTKRVGQDLATKQQLGQDTVRGHKGGRGQLCCGGGVSRQEVVTEEVMLKVTEVLRFYQEYGGGRVLPIPGML